MSNKEYKVTVHDDGLIEWKNSNNRFHRENGPARTYKDGTVQWWLNGVMHRLDGPASEGPGRSSFWYVHGKLHREDGPAVVFCDGASTERIDEYWLDGMPYLKPAFDNELKKRREGKLEQWVDTLGQGNVVMPAIKTATDTGDYKGVPCNGCKQCKHDFPIEESSDDTSLLIFCKQCGKRDCKFMHKCMESIAAMPKCDKCGFLDSPGHACVERCKVCSRFQPCAHTPKSEDHYWEKCRMCESVVCRKKHYCKTSLVQTKLYGVWCENKASDEQVWLDGGETDEYKEAVAIADDMNQRNNGTNGWIYTAKWSKAPEILALSKT